MRVDRGHHHPSYVHYFTVLLVAGVVAFGIWGSTETAHADPHAFFYTVIGQQQLFFNVLAALNQADYVEDKTRRGQLADKRDQAGFKKEDSKPLTETATDLASVLTRPITLEGQDLWSSYLSEQYAREVARRNSSSEFAAVACERGLGRLGCSRKPSQWQQDDAFVTDPLEWANRSFTEGVMGALMSGTSNDQKIREDRLTGANPRERLKPRAFSPLIAQLRDAVDHEKNQNNKAIKTQFLNYLLYSAAAEYLPDPLSQTFFNDFDINDDGSISLTFKAATKGHKADNTDYLSGTDYVDAYLETTTSVPDLINAIRGELAAGKQFITDNQAIEQQQGAVADVVVKPEQFTTGNGNTMYGTIYTNIATPAHAKLALTNALTNLIGNLDQNLLYAPPKAALEPAGKVKLVDPREDNGDQGGQ